MCLSVNCHATYTVSQNGPTSTQYIATEGTFTRHHYTSFTSYNSTIFHLQNYSITSFPYITWINQSVPVVPPLEHKPKTKVFQLFLSLAFFLSKSLHAGLSILRAFIACLLHVFFGFLCFHFLTSLSCCVICFSVCLVHLHFLAVICTLTKLFVPKSAYFWSCSGIDLKASSQ